MIVRNFAQLAGTERDVGGEGWRSRRFLRRDDAVKFSLHLTEIEAGPRLELEYANHFEANYCIAGNGESLRCRVERSISLIPAPCTRWTSTIDTFCARK